MTAKFPSAAAAALARIGRDSMRYSGMYIDRAGDKPALVATDGRVLVLVVGDGDAPGAARRLCASDAAVVAAEVGPRGAVTIEDSGDALTIIGAGSRRDAASNDGAVPRHRDVWPKQFSATASFNLQSLVTLIDALKRIGGREGGRVTFAFNDEDRVAQATLDREGVPVSHAIIAKYNPECGAVTAAECAEFAAQANRE